jgi:hypothetical protein
VRRAARALALALVASFATACSPIVYTTSAAPPSREGKLWNAYKDGEDAVVVSKGVAIAIECRDPWWGTACDDAIAKIADPKIARVLPAHLEKTREPWAQGAYADEGVSQRAVFVVAGVAEGETKLTLDSAEGQRVFRVVVRP